MSAHSVGVILLLLYASLSAQGTDSALQTESIVDRTDLRFTTPAYQNHVVDLLIQEASEVAKALSLQERLPITRSNLSAISIPPPRIGQVIGLGSIATTNYLYIVRSGQKLAEVAQCNLLDTYDRIAQNYQWPISRKDTNAAFQIATQMLAAVGIDVMALSRDCVVEITTYHDERSGAKLFVPLYLMYWLKRGHETGPSVVTFELLLPTRIVRRFSVYDPKYVSRKPLTIANLPELLSETNSFRAVVRTNR